MRNKPAQGNALGRVNEKRRSPEGAAQRARRGFIPPFQGLSSGRSPTQGVALGWLVGGPLALKNDPRTESGLFREMV